MILQFAVPPLPKLVLLFVLITLGFTADARLSNKVLVVAETFYPYQYPVDDGVQGIAVDAFKAIAKKAEIEFDIRLYPWPRALKLAESAPNTIILSITRNPQREKRFHWIGKLDEHQLYLWVDKRKWQNTEFDRVAIQQLVIGVPRQGHQHQTLKSHPELYQNKFSVVNTKEQSLSMLMMGRIDAITGDPKLLKLRMAHLGLNSDVLMPIKHFPESKNELYLAISKNSNAELVEKLKLAYGQLRDANQLPDTVQLRP